VTYLVDSTITGRLLKAWINHMNELVVDLVAWRDLATYLVVLAKSGSLPVLELQIEP